MIEVRAAHQRGRAEHGWLSSRHTFSFAEYYDPAQVGFSDLLVINDDRVAPGRGFGMHPHRDMEILSYVLEGALEHRDTMGTGSVIVPGDVQLMSAGKGIAHSEFNHSSAQPVHFLQIWIGPSVRGVEPRYQQTSVSDGDKRGKLRLIVSPEGQDGSLKIRQDARVYAGLFDGDASERFVLPPQRFAYVHVARGSVTVNGVALQEGDGARIRDEQALQIENGRQAEVLLFDLRPIEVTAEWA
ncbi:MULTISPECIES: pirin family protein [Burkholderia]|uniref:pirin family protein n=1 Tax=Burkholderia TaxID=32008 RepID=UPI00075EFBE3|nr:MULTISPECIES: pirin family protein [Burkholderia]AOJ71225.1 quercetin 2,3-dioxygenase [Burkholderia savannae]AOJ84158.1 quercetin 2,3-dioxygenase [Burkholderia savannae]KVG48707.1 quercetin 2,3-dioxygenase [Burkholderia sp. MSMB0265]KVG86163.1 quercetin 2,3-dioxygenase [Burkholderia sp. MSMB2040]KVG90446.1 quercetin 2,3-dioxygenase [Burkholderia sp. MSMB2041]